MTDSQVIYLFYLFTFSLKTGWSHSVKKLLYKRALYIKEQRNPGGRGAGGGGGYFHWRPYQMLEKKKKRVKRVSKSGVGAEREKGVKNANNGRKGYPNRYDQNSIAMRSNVERVSNLRQHVHSFWLQMNVIKPGHKTSELKLQIRSKHTHMHTHTQLLKLNNSLGSRSQN